MAAGGGGGGGGFGGGGNLAGPYVIGAVYNVSLIVDGKTIDTKPLRVNDDPEVVLTSADRKRQFDLAMEMHALQIRITDASTAYTALSRQTSDLAKTIADRTDIPAEREGIVRGVEQVARGAGTQAVGAARRPRRWRPRWADRKPRASRSGQAKNGLMGGMNAGESTMRAYTEVKSQTPKAIADLNAVIAKGSALSGTLATYWPDVDGAAGGSPFRSGAARGKRP